MALGLNSKIKFKSALRGAYFIPNVLGALVVGYIFNYFFTYILPVFGKMIGSKTFSSSMLSNTNLAWIAIVIVCAWQSIAMNTIHLHFRSSDSAGRMYTRQALLMVLPDSAKFRYLTIPADRSVFQHQHGSLCEKLPDGI